MNDDKDLEIVVGPTGESQIEQSVVKTYTTEELPDLWNSMIPILEMGHYLYGSKNMSKMIMFLKECKMKKEQIDFWLDFQKFPASRNIDEQFPDYKIRMKFQNALLKYRYEIKAFIIMNAMQDFIDTQKKKSEDTKRLEIEKEITNK